MAHSKPLDPALFDNLRLELRRGCLTIAVLAALRSTLYPLLRRLETQGLLVSEWREDARRNKRFYRLSDLGAQTLTQLLAEWREIDASLNGILTEIAHGSARKISTGR
jgi:PadR family transcriptional regulator PadR